MTLDEAVDAGEGGRWLDAQLRVSPSNCDEWFVLLRDRDYKSFVLLDNEQRPIAMSDLNSLARCVQSVGLREFTVFF